MLFFDDFDRITQDSEKQDKNVAPPPENPVDPVEKPTLLFSCEFTGENALIF